MTEPDSEPESEPPPSGSPRPDSESEPPPSGSPRPDSESEPPPSGSPRPAARAASWEPPPTFSDKFSHYSRKLIRLILVAVALVVVVTFFLWAVPTYQVLNSDAYDLAVAKIETHRGVRSFLGGPVTCERVPVRYALTDDGGRLAFVVHGSYGRGLVDVEVKGGKVIRVRPQYAIDWARPLSTQLPPIPSSD